MLNDLVPHVVRIRSNQSRTVPHTTNYTNYRNILEILPGIRQGTGHLRGRPWSGLVKFANCGIVLWAGKSAAIV